VTSEGGSGERERRRVEKKNETEMMVEGVETFTLLFRTQNAMANASPPTRPSLEEEAIEPEDWDLIVLGSGLSECLVARSVEQQRG